MPMRFSLSTKLFSAIFAAVLLVVFTITVAVAVNMRAGFSTYLLNVEMARLDDLRAALSLDSEAAEGWPQLTDPAEWARFIEVRSNLVEVPRPPPPPFDSDRPPPPHQRDPMQPGERLSLLRPDGSVVAGPLPGSERAVFSNLSAPDGSLLGYLRLSVPYGAGVPADQLFRASQVHAFAVILMIGVLLSGLAAWLLTRNFMRPIEAIGTGLARLASGQYGTRLMVDRSDALGKLMADHNALAESLTIAREREQNWITDTSHELKTPLALLRAEIEALQDGVRSVTPDALARLHAGTMRLSQLVSDLNQSLTADTGANVLAVRRVVDLTGLVREAVSAMRPRADGFVITVDASTPHPVSGDPVRLRQVIDNVLENSLRYTAAPGRIILTCAKQGSACRLTIEDTAPGPKASDLPRLFERFYRAESSRARVFGGSGLGLAICRSIIVAHGGTIAADLSNLGGLLITVTVPLVEEPSHG